MAAVALKHDFYGTDRLMVPSFTVQVDQQGAEAFLTDCLTGETMAILKLKHGQPAQVTPRINGIATGLPVDDDGHLLIEGYQWVGIEEA